MDVITTHVNADFDSLGAMVGAKKLYPEAVLAFAGAQEKTLRQFLVESTLYAIDVVKARQVDLDAVRRLILVDVAQAERIGRFGVLVGRPGVELHVYDHHPPGPDDVRPDVAHVDRVGAATTLLVELLRQRRIPVQPDEATLMIFGIYEDTGCLTFGSTTPRDLEAAAWLLGQGADVTAVTSVITPELTVEQVSLLDGLLRSRTVRRIHGKEVVVAEASTDEYVGDLAVLAHKIRDMENLDALVLLVRMEDRVQLVGRSRVPEVDMARLAREFGGGGHPEAASATIRDLTLIEAREKLLALLPRAVRPPTTARDIWSTPVKSVPSGMSLAEVGRLLDRYHINAMPVLRRGRVVGIVTRLLVGRALQHGLLEVPVDDYMVTEFATVPPSAPLERLRELIIWGNQRFLPVLEDGKLLGAVTRTDLLRAMEGLEKGAPLEVPFQAQERFAGRLLEERLPPAVLGRLRDLGRLAQEGGAKAYLVGGIVRDLLLRRDNLDIDVVVEGDGLALASEAARQWGAKVRAHPVFGTAKIITADGLHIDVATARTEYYRRPASLPTVEWSSLKLDLYRRDFTVNTLALRLAPDRLGEVIDFFGSLRDLKEGMVRILHNLSFVEDPTRILRALRFQLRFGFRLGRQTQKLLRSAVRMGFLSQARGRRLFHEWVHLMEEADPLEALDALDEHGILAAIHPGLRLTPKSRELLVEVKGVVTWFELLYLDTPLRRWMVYLLALFDAMDEADVEELLRSFGVAEREGRDLLANRRQGYRALLELREELSRGEPRNSRVYEILVPCPAETLLFLMAKTEDEAKRRLISRYWTQLAGVRPFLGGRDLKELGIPPGAVYRKLLAGLLAARLDNEVASREDEIAWVKRQGG
ncbi:MAG: CBS domain-containing protein [Deferrisomatales bacterium]|nr:CBS domain-containing protein [Deferrisomatales bacterium]